MKFALLTLTGLFLLACTRAPLEVSPDELVSAGGSRGAASAGGGAGGGAGGASNPAAQNCTDHSSTQSQFTTDYGGTFVTVDGSSKQYYWQANWWGLFNQQSETVDGLSFSVANPARASSGSNNPMGYPSLFIGSYAGHSTTGSNLPKQVSALTKVYTVLSTNASGKGYSNYNAAYDVWLTASGAPLPTYQYDPGSGGAYLMVWLFKPTDRQPRGINSHPGQTVPGIPGTWDVWVDNTDPPCISYVSSKPLDELAFDLNNFILDSVANSYGITRSMYLSIIFAGFEIWGGADGIKANAFCANVP
jgi:hypothetical protein